MNKFLPIGIVVIVALVGIGFVVSSQSKQQENTVQQQPENAMMESTKQPQSRYLEYGSGIVEQAAGKRRILFFYASWCSTCIPTDADLRAKAGTLPEDVVVIRVNYNDPETDQEEKDLAQKYGITYQHTFVQIDEQGNEVTKWNGGQTEELTANIK